MTWDAVPWFVGGGAQHSPEVARLLAYAATSGAEGIVTPGDLKVTPLDVPGTAVKVMAGAGLILNRAAGGGQQTYVARLPEPDQVAIAATGSGAGRSDLIVAQVEDPFMPGEPWQEPADPTQGPYMFTRVISNVPAGTKRLQDVAGYAGASALTLARVDLPASTGTVTAAMVTDLRKVAQPRRETVLDPLAFVTGEEETLTATNPNGEYWPDAAGERWPLVDIPAWATRMKVVITWAGIKTSGNSWGTVWVQLGNNGDANLTRTQDVVWDTPNTTGNSRFVIVAADDVPVPAAFRGTQQRIRPRGRIAGGTGSARPMVDWGSAIVRQVEFYETAV